LARIIYLFWADERRLVDCCPLVGYLIRSGQHTLATMDWNRQTVQFKQVAMMHQAVVSWRMMFGEVVG
jgi:hypothetical protein